MRNSFLSISESSEDKKEPIQYDYHVENHENEEDNCFCSGDHNFISQLIEDWLQVSFLMGT